MHAADTVFVLRREVFEDGEIAGDIGADGIHDILADQAGGVGDTVGELAAFRIEHEARGFAATCGEDDDAGS